MRFPHFFPKETKEQVSMIKDEDTLRNTQTVQIIKNKEKELELKKQKALVFL